MERDRNVKYRSDTQDLIMVDDEKADETYDVGAIEINNDAPITGLIESNSNVSCISSGSAKSTSSKKRVTFSGLADSLMFKNDTINNNDNDENDDRSSKHKKSQSDKIITTIEPKTPINHKKPKKEDGFARARLLRIKKYKFDGIYFGGVDLKSGKRIKVPTQKSIRTRRRTYSADVGPRSPSSSPRPSPRTPRSNSTHSKSNHQQSISRSHSARRINNNNSSTPRIKKNKIKKSSTPRKIKSSSNRNKDRNRSTPRSRKRNSGNRKPSSINTTSDTQYKQQQSPRPRGKTTPVKSKISSKPGFMTKHGYNRPLPATPTRSRSRKSKKNHHNIKNRKSRSSSTALHRNITPMKMKGIRGSNTIQRNSMKRSKTDRDNQSQKSKKKIALEKSKSISTEEDETFLATISSEDDKAATPKRSPTNTTYNNSTNSNTVVNGKYHVTPKWKKHGNKSKHKSKGKKKKKNSNNNHYDKNVNNNNNNNDKKNGYKSYNSMTDTEDGNNSGIFGASFWTDPPGLAVARSLDVTEVSPKSPSYGANFIVDSESPPPLPKSPSPERINNTNNTINLITRDNIKMHNIHMHRPLGSNSFGGSHSVQLSYESKSSSRDSVCSNGYDDVGSVYSHTSQLSETWSEYGSVTETLDDYFEALSKLGAYASNGYMHVITTSGKGKNIDIKLKALHEACNKKCLLAVASGIRTENVETFLPYVDILMVSTCISHDFHVFDPRKMSKFKRVVDNYFEKL